MSEFEPGFVTAHEQANVPADKTPERDHLPTTGTKEVSSRLRLPHRGDQLAGIALFMAVGGFAWLILELQRLAIVNFNSDVPLLSPLNYASVGLTLVGFAWSFFKDLRWLRAEELDIQKLVTNRNNAQKDPSVLLDSKGQRRIETLLDDRIARAGLDSTDAAAPLRESELRAVAAWRSATLGSLARYTSGLLLLMTVLGTFVGVKSSMDPLREALLRSTDSGAQATADALAAPLGQVAAAFGANLTALVGSIALGLVAWGFSVGRQNMLARLEQVSSLYVYSRAKHKGPAEQLAAAAAHIAQAGGGLNAAAVALTEVNGTIKAELGEVREALNVQLGALSDSVGDFSASIDDSLKQTRQTLKALLEQQAVQVAEESRRTVDRVERQITDTTIAVQQATALYGTMVGRLQGDVETVATTAATLRDTLVELRGQREAFGRYADDATKTMDARLAVMDKAARRQLKVSRRVHAQYAGIESSLKALIGHVTELGFLIADAERRRIEAQETLHERTATRVAELTAPILSDVQRSIDKLEQALTALPAAVGAAVRDSAPVVPKGPPAQVPPGSTDLVRVVMNLTNTLQKLEERAAQPAWRRLFASGR